MFFDTGTGVGKAAAAAAMSYASLLVVLRISGKRTLAKLNAFDLVVTVALGSALSTVALSRDVALVEGVAVLAVLVTLQLAVAWLSVRLRVVRHVVKSTPTLLVHDGRLRVDTMRAQRIHEDEVHQALRAAGVGGVELVEAVVLETDGTLSVVTRDRAGSANALPAVESQ